MFITVDVNFYHVCDLGSVCKELILLFFLNKFIYWASLVAQWLRIHLPMQGTRVRALIWGDPTCRGATKPVHHNY